MSQRDEKTKAKQAIIFNCENILTLAFSAISDYTKQRRLLRIKRQDLSDIIRTVDSN